MGEPKPDLCHQIEVLDPKRESREGKKEDPEGTLSEGCGLYDGRKLDSMLYIPWDCHGDRPLSLSVPALSSLAG